MQTCFSRVELIYNIYYDLDITPSKDLTMPCYNTHFHLTHAQWCFHKVRIVYTNMIETEIYVFSREITHCLLGHWRAYESIAPNSVRSWTLSTDHGSYWFFSENFSPFYLLSHFLSSIWLPFTWILFLLLLGLAP